MKQYIIPQLRDATKEQLKIVGIAALIEMPYLVFSKYKYIIKEFARKNSLNPYTYADRQIRLYISHSIDENTTLEEIVEAAQEIRDIVKRNPQYVIVDGPDYY